MDALSADQGLKVEPLLPSYRECPSPAVRTKRRCVRFAPAVAVATLLSMAALHAARSTRPLPYVGMEVAIVHLGVRTPAVVDAVRDHGRTLVAGGQTFELSPLTAHFVRAGDPYYGVRLALSPGT
jgi:peptidase E